MDRKIILLFATLIFSACVVPGGQGSASSCSMSPSGTMLCSSGSTKPGFSATPPPTPSPSPSCSLSSGVDPSNDPLVVSELCAQYDMPVLVVNYIPVGTTASTTVLKGLDAFNYSGSAQLDTSESGESGLVRDLIPNLVNGANQLASYLTDATRYHGYSNTNAIPALKFRIVDTITILQARDYASDPDNAGGLGYRRGYPLGGTMYRHPYDYIFGLADICSYVKNQGVKFAYLYSYHSNNGVPAESLSAGPYGNVGNSESGLANYLLYCNNGVGVSQPAQSNTTYHMIDYHPTATATFAYPTSNSVEDFTHHIEAVFGSIDGTFWSTRYVSNDGHATETSSAWWMPGVAAGSVFTWDNVQQNYGIDIHVDNVDTTVAGWQETLHVSQNATYASPDRSVASYATDVAFDQSFTLTGGGNFAVTGKDIQIKVWGNWENNVPKAFFEVYRLSGDAGIVKRCGWTHFPPNGESNYDWTNSFWKVRSDCENWSPDESGTIMTGVDCHLWADEADCVQDATANHMGTDLGYKKWWMQNIPGRDNGLFWNHDTNTYHVRNFWAFLDHYDQARAHLKQLELVWQPSVIAAPPSALTAVQVGSTIKLDWTASTSSGVTGYNIFRGNPAATVFHRVNNALLPASTLEYIDSLELVPGQDYLYQVKAVTTVQSESAATATVTLH